MPNETKSTTAMSRFKRGDVLQLSPDESANTRVAGCLGIFTGKCRVDGNGTSWPVLMIIAPQGELHEIMIRDEDVDYVGVARYMPETEWMPVTG
jgi:hypothetical protein